MNKAKTAKKMEPTKPAEGKGGSRRKPIVVEEKVQDDEKSSSSDESEPAKKAKDKKSSAKSAGKMPKPHEKTGKGKITAVSSDVKSGDGKQKPKTGLEVYDLDVDEEDPVAGSLKKKQVEKKTKQAEKKPEEGEKKAVQESTKKPTSGTKESKQHIKPGTSTAAAQPQGSKSPEKQSTSENSEAKNAELSSGEKKNAQQASYFKFMSRGGPKNVGSKEIPVGADGFLKGLTFVQSGVLASFESDDIKNVIEKYGGRVTSAVSRKTNYLLLGEDAGANKTKKALELNIPTMSEDEFLNLIRASNPAGNVKQSQKFFGVGDDDEEDKGPDEANDEGSEDAAKPTKAAKRPKGDHDLVSKAKKIRKN